MSTVVYRLIPLEVINLTEVIELQADSYYLFQCLLPGPIYITEVLNTDPTPLYNSDGHVISQQATWLVKQETDTSFYAWGQGAVAVTQANF